MRYVILRDDDTNALTPVECLERLYRPFLERGLPVNLAVIPEVSTRAEMANGRPEGFLLGQDKLASVPGDEAISGAPAAAAGRRRQAPDGRVRFEHLGEASSEAQVVPLCANPALVSYLLGNPGYHVVQHGCHHDYLEFDRPARADLRRRLDRGTQRLVEAGFPAPRTFVAPYDKLSRAALQEVAKQFRVLSTGWYELRRLPLSWWPRYALKKLRRRPHWQIGRTLLLSHPGCLLSCQRSYATMLRTIEHYLQTQQLTVLVTHWWEYFREQQTDQPFIEFLHETAAFLANHREYKVISFTELAEGRVALG